MTTFGTRPILGLAGFVCLMISIFTAGTAAADEIDPTLPVLTWQHGDLTNTDGEYTLAWSPSPENGDYDFVRIEVSTDGAGDWHPHFVTGGSQGFASFAQGERLYRLRACVLTEDSGESCGAVSGTVSVTSTAAVETARTPVPRSSLPEPDPARLSEVPGGAGEVLPGAYIAENKRRTGWNLHWVNDLRCKFINPDNCVYGDVNELWILWSTYRDFSNHTGDPNLQPVWLMGGLRAHETEARRFDGSLHYYRVVNGQVQNWIYGEITLRRGWENNTEHSVTWKVYDASFYHGGVVPQNRVYDTLKHQSNYEGIGVDPLPNEIDHFQGWWLTPSETPAHNKFIWASHITNKWEFGVLAFFDGNGDPIWGAAQWGGWHRKNQAGQPAPITPPQYNAPFCVYAVAGHEYFPDQNTDPNFVFPEVVKLENDTCELHPEDGQDGEGWNLKRSYGPLEESNPDGPGQPGTMNLQVYVPQSLRNQQGGAKTLLYGPAYGTGIMHKWVSNHEIRYFVDGDLENPNPSSCVKQNGICHLILDWFSDGHYPYAKLYLFRKDENGNWIDSGVAGEWPTDGPYSVQGETLDIADAGTYRLELRRHSNTSQVLAYTRQFEVTAPAAEISISPVEHDFGNVLPGDESLKTFTVTNTGPEGSTLRIQGRSVQSDGFTIWTGNPGTTCNANTDLSGGESCIVTARFAALGAANGTGPYSATLDVESSVGDVSVELSATVVASCAAGAGTNGLLEADPGELPTLEFTVQTLADTPGVFELSWTDKQGGAKQPDIYALTRVSLDGPDEQPAVHFLSDPQARVMHYAPGSWRYTVRACEIDGKQRRCGAPSDPLTLDVSAGPERGRQSVPRPVPPGPAPQSSPPSQLAVGQYKSGLTDNNGWFFSWDSQLRFESNWEDEFELKAVWATYRNLSGSNQPGQQNLQPVWLTTDRMIPDLDNDNVYHGSLNYITVANGVKQDNWIGSVTVCLNSMNQGPPRVEWRLDGDDSFYESGTVRTVIDELEVVYDPNANCDNGVCDPDTNDIDQYQGLWEMNAQSGHHASMSSWIIGNLETNLLAFWDGDGEPIWGFSIWYGFDPPPPYPPWQAGQGTAPFCLYGVANGWYPDVPFPTGQSGHNVPYGDCNPDPDDISDIDDYNLQRRFIYPPDRGIGQNGKIELDITVPGDFRGANEPAFTRQTGTLDMEKTSGFHGIRYSISGDPDPSTCVLSQQGGNCVLVLRWFTGGDYEDAHLFVHRVGGSTTLVEDSGWQNGGRSRTNVSYPIDEPGKYTFELRTSDVASSRLLARSGQLEVEPGCDESPPAWSPGEPSGTIAVPPDDPLTPEFQWDDKGATEYDLRVWQQGETASLINVTLPGDTYAYQPTANPGFDICIDDGESTCESYAWQVTARNDQWCGETSESSEAVFDFVPNCTPPPAAGPSLTQPEGIEPPRNMPPTFAWKKVLPELQGVEYKLQVWEGGDTSGDPLFPPLVVVDSYSLSPDGYDYDDWTMNQTYTWQVEVSYDNPDPDSPYDRWCDTVASQQDFRFEPTTEDPENPPDIKADPDFQPDPDSSRVGATAGEFRVDESGAANYSIPIMTVPGSGGVTPEISLNYNSHGGRGPLGQGWSLSGFSTISRCGQTIEQDGTSTGVRLDAEDRFCLDGQKLVLVPGTGAYGASGSEYRLEIDDFSRITAHGNLNGSPTHFEVRRKDGSLSTYGTPCHPGLENCSPSPSARVLTKGADPVVFAWPISRFEDSVGNFIEYLYDHPDPGWIEWVPLAVLYTGHELYNDEPFASIQFVHIDLEDPPAKAGAVDTRPGEPVLETETGATTGFVAGQKVRSTRLLDFIDSVGNNDKNELIRRYHLHYVEDAFGRPLLKRVRECGGTAAEICFNATEFQWLAGKLSIPDASARGVYLNGFKESAKAGDVTGDGRQEAVYLFQASGSARFAAVVNTDPHGLNLETTTAINAECNLAHGDFRNRKADWQLMDVEGTGYQGLVYAASKCSNPADNGIYFHRWLRVEDGLGQFTPTGIRIGALPSELDNRKVRIQAVDWNGDGLADILLTAPEGETNLSRDFYLYQNESTVSGEPKLGEPLTFGTLAEEPPMCPPPPGGSQPVPPTNVSYYVSLFDTPVAEVDQSGRVAFVAKILTDVDCDGTNSESDGPPLHLDIEEFKKWWEAQRGEEPQGDSYSIPRIGIFQLDEIVGDTVNLKPWPGFGAAGFDDIVIPADANGDGYTDFVLLRERQGSDSCGPGEDWVAELYLNDGRFLHDQCLFGIDSLEIAAQVRVFDYGGNGYADILVPSDHNATAAVWQVHEWLPDENGGTFSDIPFNGTWAGKLDKSLPLFLDMHGDGATDVLQFYKSGDAPGCSGGNGDWCLLAARGEIDQGASLGRASGFIPLNRINRITDGFGAWTHISYKSLAQRSVYTRHNGGPYTGWGNGSVVYDMVMPMYVVSAAESLAPRANGGNSTRIEYYYGGAKLQGGGRGMLGFRDVASYDPNSQILTHTQYWQAFPRTGLPRFTQSSYQPDEPWPTTDDLTDVDWCGDEHLEPIDPDPEPMGAAPDPVEDCMPRYINPGQVLGLAENTWGVLTTDTQHPYLARSEEWSATPRSHVNGTFLSRTFTHVVVTEINNLDSWGNPGEVVVSTYTSNGLDIFGDLVARQTTVNRYDPSRLHLGRLTSATVTSERPGQATKTRISTFGYDPATGILDRETVNASHYSDTLGSLTTTYFLDDFGNREETWVTGDGIDRRSLKQYDSAGRFVESRQVWIEGDWETTETVNQRDRYGNPTQVTDGRGVITWHYYDHMGRPHYTYTQNGAWSRVQYANASGSECPAYTAYKEIRTAPGNHVEGSKSETQICRDVLGRETRTRTLRFNQGWSQVDTRYDYASRVAWVSEPHPDPLPDPCDPDEQICQVLWNDTTYDIAGQVVRTRYADQSRETWAYIGLRTEHTNQREKVHTVITNPLGEKVEEIAADTGVTKYTYDSLGQLIGTDGPLPGTQDLITIGYDELGHKLWMNDPDKGNWQYRHNSLGELRCQKDEEGKGVEMLYDDLGRLEKRRDLYEMTGLHPCTGTEAGVSEWTYGNTSGQGRFGQIVAEKSDFNEYDYDDARTGAIVVPQGPAPSRAFERHYLYDDLGRNTQITTHIFDDGVIRTYIEETTYDQFGRVFQQFDASGGSRGVRYHYNPRGYVIKLQEAREGEAGVDYWTVHAMDVRGNVTKARLANGLTAHASHHPKTGRLKRRWATDSGGLLVAQDLELFWDAIGNLQYRYDHDQALYECFEYDVRNRLSEVKHPAHINEACGNVTSSYISVAYNESGNITSKSDVGGYGYGAGGAGPHAVTSAGGRTFQYDGTGNVISDSLNRGYSYTTFNRLRRVTSGNGTTDFFYGPNREKVIKRDAAGSTHYVGNVEIVRESAQIKYRRYIGGVVLMTFDENNTYVEERYLHKDHLGSATAVTDHYGNVVTRMAYDPWGQRRKPDDLSAPWQQWTQSQPVWAGTMLGITPRGYTGHEQVDDHGVVLMGARVYDPRLGRFLQADPFVEDSTTLNRYTYVHNNPLIYTDPSGNFGLLAIAAGAHRLRQVTGRSFMRAIGPEASAVATGVGCGVVGVVTVGWGGAACAAVANYEMTRAFGGSKSDAFRNGAIAGATAAAFSGASYGIGQLGLSAGATYGLTVLAHGTIGGVQHSLQGGKFGHGFAAAGLTAAAAPGIAHAPGGVVGRTIAAAVVGGTASSITGGKFANGAVTGAMSYAFGEIAARSRSGAANAPTGSATVSGTGEWHPPLLAPETVPVAFTLEAGLSIDFDAVVTNWMRGAEGFFASHGVHVTFDWNPARLDDALVINVGNMTVRDNLRYSAAGVVSEINMNWTSDPIVFAHEVGHAFGLRDRYMTLPSGRARAMPGYRGNVMADLGPNLTHSQLSVIRANINGGWQRDLRMMELR